MSRGIHNVVLSASILLASTGAFAQQQVPEYIFDAIKGTYELPQSDCQDAKSAFKKNSCEEIDFENKPKYSFEFQERNIRTDLIDGFTGIINGITGANFRPNYDLPCPKNQPHFYNCNTQ